MTERRSGLRHSEPLHIMKKHFRKLLSILTLICCLSGFLQPLAAEAEEEVTRVTFENEQNNSPDLYVTKKIESASGDYEAPAGLRFTFILRLNGSLADRLEYRVFDENGSEVYNYSDGESTEDKSNKIPYRTDRSGTFTLAPGQTARFEYVGVGTSYEVTEVQTDGWIQTTPSGGAPATGTVTDNGAWANFVNLTGESGGEAKLLIRKDISFPDGYEAPETPDFTFYLELSNKPWAQEPYTVIDTVSGSETGSGITGSDGSFTLKGGQTAQFENIPQDTDYKVTEQDADGWRISGNASQEGTTGTSGTVTVYFNNANASFIVSKTMQDGSKPDKEFTFLLTDANRTVWRDAPYLLYYTTGEQVLDDEGNPVEGATDENGNFTLKPGQAALFTGIETGTVYNVSEIGDPDYVQVVPSSAEGYTDKTVTDAVEVLPFVNREAEGGLSVTKRLVNSDDEAPLEQKEFTFVLRKLEEEEPDAEATYELVEGAVYSLETGTSQYTYATDSEGKFTLKANETARFTGLPAGDYQVEELQGSLEYIAQVKVQEGSLTSSEPNLSFIFTNEYSSRLFNLYLIKEDHSDNALAGAEFMLYRDEMNQNPVQEEPYVTDSGGKITVESLKTGTYYLVETKAPEGYQLLANPVKIDVTWLEDVMQVTVDDKTITSTEEDDQIYIVQNSDEADEVHIKIYNSRNFTLPVTGGTAVLLGVALVGIAVLMITMWRLGKKKSVGKDG